ncbi:hypothetical protein [Sphingomonas sp. CFBP 8765]|uniref:hypothetical protein n=1 Tax=Sphingomonas sp. CFBP 8765 TaxID=2775274 RepID=UPI00177F3B60|nr:hypothetical protein [Sphingomonas sp. CFBP 8765]MBD8472169.1 hypothetical protein [Sphingomonas sp. CFBP 8765]
MSWPNVLSHWPSIATAGAGLGMGGLLKTLLDHRRATRLQTDEVAMSLVQQLTRRVETVEAGAAQERVLCDANLAVLRHRVNNLSGSFGSLLLMIEMAPDRAREFATRIKEQRAMQEQTEATEKASLAAAAITGACSKGVGV